MQPPAEGYYHRMLITVCHTAKPALGRDDQRSSIATAAGMIGALATADPVSKPNPGRGRVPPPFTTR